MARKFVMEVIAQEIEGTNPVLSSVEHADLLGSADELVFQVTTDRVSGTQPKLTLKYNHSNNGQRFSAKNPNPIPETAIITSGNLMSGAVAGNGAFGQVEVVLSAESGTPGAFVRVIACGRVL